MVTASYYSIIRLKQADYLLREELVELIGRAHELQKQNRYHSDSPLSTTICAPVTPDAKSLNKNTAT